MHPLFSGPLSLRIRGERLAFGLCLLWALPIAGIIAAFAHETIGEAQVALFVVAAMVYVTLARGRLLGSSVRIHEAQHEQLFSIVRRCATALELPMPLVFVRDDDLTPITIHGFGEPYALVFSVKWLEEFRDDELAFHIGRQLAHVAAGHARYLSLLSVTGRENALVSFIFGPWLRRCELTCDRVGLLACGSFESARRAIAVAAFHRFGRSVELNAFAEQGREIAGDSVLKWGQWLSGEPYATQRISELRSFADSRLFEEADAWFLSEREALARSSDIVERVVERADCTRLGRRALALLIDTILVGSLLSTIKPIINRVLILPSTSHTISSNANHASDVLFAISLYLYLVFLVGLTGQSFGMIITGLRVVTPDFTQPSFLTIMWRYFVGLALIPVVAIVGLFRGRILIHDSLSKTRLIRTERLLMHS